MTPSSDPAATNRATYDRIAGAFAARYDTLTEVMAGYAERLLACAGAGGRVLDLGCGSGRDLAWFRQRGARVTGADLSAGMLAEARARAGLPLAQMEMRRLGFAGGSFQGIWCCAALLHLPKDQLPAALAEITRVLAPGGALTVSVQQGEGEGIEASPYEGHPERFFARYSLEEMSARLDAASFQVRRMETMPYGHGAWLWFETVRR